jgi:hypothetical protein
MKALKDCEWNVTIEKFFNSKYYWSAETSEKDSGIDCGSFPSMDYKSKTAAKKAWEKFAKLNGITNYKIED